MTAVELVLDFFQLLLIFGPPGIAILLLLKAVPEGGAATGIFTVATSLAYLTIVSLFLLHLRIFSITTLIVASLLPAILAVLRWRNTVAQFKDVVWMSRSTLPALLVAGFAISFLLLTPHWNFLVAPGMDAGNYEVYSNHFWTTGSFHLDASNLIASGVDPAWIDRPTDNTWNLDTATGEARPSYLPGYPIFLGILKVIFSTAVISYAGNVGLAALSLMLIVLIATDLGNRRSVAALIAAALFFTPIFFYYSKQLMAEQLGLLSMLLILYSLIRIYNSAPSSESFPRHYPALGISVGIVLGTLSRLDFLPVLAFLIVAYLVSAFDAWALDNPITPARTLYLWSPIAVIVSTLIVGLVAHPSYLQHAVPGPLEGSVTPSGFVSSFGIVAAVLLAASNRIPHILSRLSSRIDKTRIVFLSQVSAATLAGIWLAFVGWNLTIRAEGTAPAGHDAINLKRLFSVVSGPLLGIALILTTFEIIRRSSHRGAAFLITAGFSMAVYASQHSAPDLWWMRRYLAWVVPLVLLVIGGSLGYLMNERSRYRQAIGRLAMVGLALLIVVQGWQISPLFSAHTNEDVPYRLAQLTRAVPDGALVVTLEGNSMVKGLAITYRSVSDETVLVGVPMESLDAAIAVAETRQDVVILSPAPLEDEVAADLNLVGPKEAMIERQWVNWLELIYENPNPSKRFPFFIYLRDSL